MGCGASTAAGPGALLLAPERAEGARPARPAETVSASAKALAAAD